MNFLLKGDRGAAAVLGATTLTEAENEAELARLLFNEVGRVLEPGVTLGEAVLRAKRELAKTRPEALDVLLGWTILGDALISIEP